MLKKDDATQPSGRTLRRIIYLQLIKKVFLSCSDPIVYYYNLNAIFSFLKQQGKKLETDREYI